MENEKLVNRWLNVFIDEHLGEWERKQPIIGFSTKITSKC